MSNREPRFNIGTQFMTRGKFPKVCTVTDILKTYNSKGDLVHVAYAASHQFMGQNVVEEVQDATIAIGKTLMEGR